MEKDSKSLNPFALPSETDARFILVIVSAIAITISLSFVRYFPILPSGGEFFLEIGQKTLTYRYITIMSFKNAYIALTGLLPSCLTIVFTLFIAYVAYITHPNRIRRRRKLQRYSTKQDDKLANEINAICQQIDVKPPDVQISDNPRGMSGQAYGTEKKPVILLDKGMRLLLAKSPEAFQAIFRHELAHIVNVDVWKTYFAQSLWLTIAIFVIGPKIITSFGYLIYVNILAPLFYENRSINLISLLTDYLPNFIGLVIRSIALLILIAFVWSGLLRIRELYADFRAAMWGSKKALSSILKKGAEKEKSGAGVLLRFHPSSQTRLDCISNPAQLFKLKFDMTIVVGILLGILLSASVPISFFTTAGLTSVVAGTGAYYIEIMESAAGSILSAQIFGLLYKIIQGVSVFVGFLPSALLLGYFVAATIGIQIQREAMQEIVTGRHGTSKYLKLILHAIVIGVGLEIGILIAPFSALMPFNLGEAVLQILWVSGISFFTFLSFIYVKFFSKRILMQHKNPSIPYREQKLLTIVQTAILTICYLPFSYAVTFVLSGDVQSVFSIGLSLLGIFAVLFIICLFGFGLSWVIFAAFRVTKIPRCIKCDQLIPQNIEPDGKCERCGNLIMQWLYVNESPA